MAFTIKVDHLKLLNKSNWDFCDAEFGAPCMDPKRPYGNSGVITDITKILDRKNSVCPHCGKILDENLENELQQMHEDLTTVLQIIFSTMKIEVGTYQRTDQYNNRSWRKI